MGVELGSSNGGTEGGESASLGRLLKLGRKLGRTLGERLPLGDLLGGDEGTWLTVGPRETIWVGSKLDVGTELGTQDG